MSNKNTVFELLSKNRLTSKEISEKIDVKESLVRVYLSRLLKDGKIRKLEVKEGRYCLYAAIKEDSGVSVEIYKKKLKDLYEFMERKMTPKFEPTQEDFLFIKEISELIA